MNNWDAFGGVHLRVILKEQPELAEKCDLGKLDGEDWRVLVETQPRFFAAKCDWSKLSGFDWAELLPRHPQYAEKCDWSKLDGNDWARLICDCSCKIMHYEAHCDWKKLNGADWECVLRHRPDLDGMCDWKKLELHNWARLLALRPELSEVFEKMRKKWRHTGAAQLRADEDMDFLASLARRQGRRTGSMEV